MIWLVSACTGPEPVVAPAPHPVAEAWAEYGPEAPEVVLVDVAVPRELRGLWVATVSNLDFPSRTGLSPSAMKRELDALVEETAALGMNALVFQVRPEGDALYRSKLEPWSRFLSGKQGRDPGLDPLEYLIEKAHERSIEVHAWFNPYRASSSRGVPTAPNHVSKWASKSVRPWGNVLWLDPGVPEVQDHAVAVIDDVVARYDIDGVHLDDYFYPYPDGRLVFQDDSTYQTYRKSGGKLAKPEWRASNVNRLVERLATGVQTRRPEVRFGISPFGIYRPGKPAGIRGLDQVAMLHADPLKWFAEGWVDYLAPQLYWPTTAKAQAYDRLLEWWNDQVDAARPLVVGLDLTKVGRDPKWPLAELRKQVELSRAQDHTSGQIWFRATPVLKNQAGVGDLLDELYAHPALPPALARVTDPFDPPRVSVQGRELSWSHPEAGGDRSALRAFVLYEHTSAGWEVRQILGRDSHTLGLGPGTWAVSAVSRTGAESKGVEVHVEDGADGVAEP